MIPEQIKYAEILGIETEIKELISSEIYDREQIDVLLLAFKQGISIENIKIMASPLFDFHQMDLIRQALFSGMELQSVLMFARAELSYIQMREIFYSLASGISAENTLDIAKSYTPAKEMAFKRYRYLVNQEKDIKSLVRLEPVTTSEKQAVILEKKQNEVAKNDFQGFNNNQMLVIKKALKAKLMPSQMDFFKNRELDATQMNSILWGFTENKLSEIQVSIYAKPSFDAEQMNEIRKALSLNINVTDIAKYFTPDFEARQMSYLRIALQRNFSPEQMKYIADSKITGSKMNDIIMGFSNGFTAEDLGLEG